MSGVWIMPLGPIKLRKGEKARLIPNLPKDKNYIWRRNSAIISDAFESVYEAYEAGIYSYEVEIEGIKYISKPLIIEAAPSTPTIISLSKAIADSGEVITSRE